MTTLARISPADCGPAPATAQRAEEGPRRGAGGAFEDVLDAASPSLPPATSGDHAPEPAPGAAARPRQERVSEEPAPAAGNSPSRADLELAGEPRRKGRARHGRAAAAGQGERDTPVAGSSAGAAPAAQVAAQLALQAAATSGARASSPAGGSADLTGAPVARHARRAPTAPEAGDAPQTAQSAHAAHATGAAAVHAQHPAPEPSAATEREATAAAAHGGATVQRRPSRRGETLDGADAAEPGGDAHAAASPHAPPFHAGAAPLADHAEPVRPHVEAPSPISTLPIEPGEAMISGAVTPTTAHLHLSSDTLGDLALHLRIQDGAAHVRLEGGSRAAVEAGAPELARALAAEGIGLARLEHEPNAGNPQQGGSPPSPGDLPGDRRDSGEGRGSAGAEDGPDAPAPRPSSHPAPRTARTHAGKLDVTA